MENSRGDFVEAYNIVTVKEAMQLGRRFFELGPNKVTRGESHTLLRNIN